MIRKTRKMLPLPKLTREDKKQMIIGLLIVAWFVVWTILLSNAIGEEAIKAYVSKRWVRWPLGIIILKTLTVVAAPLSWTAFYFIAWSLYGVWLWFFYISIGNFLWLTIAFFIGRRRWKKAVQAVCWKKTSEKIIMLMQHLTSRKKFLIARLVLLPLEDMLSYAAGLSRIGYRTYVLISMLVISVYAVAFIRLWDASILW